MQQRLIDWFNGLYPREQRLLLPGAAAAVVFAFYQLLWQPLLESARALENENRQAASALQWMVQNRPALESLRGLRQTQDSGERRSLNEIVDQASAEHKAPLSRFQPNGEDAAQVWLDDVPIDNVLSWLDALENRHAVTATGVAIKLLENPGQVNVRARLAQ